MLILFSTGTGTLAEMTFVWSEAKFDYPKAKPIIFYGKNGKNYRYLRSRTQFRKKR